MAGYLIVHKWRSATQFNNTIVYHDSFSGNQDPYIWSDPFIYSFCKTYWLSTAKRPVSRGDYLFFLTAPSVANGLNTSNGPIYCDLVFKVSDWICWKKNKYFKYNWAAGTVLNSWNNSQKKDAYLDHFMWPRKGQHLWKKRHLITYIADQKNSFQPQININPPKTRGTINLIDVSKCLLNCGITSLPLQPPLQINLNIVTILIRYIQQNCNLFLTGTQLRV